MEIKKGLHKYNPYKNTILYLFNLKLTIEFH